VPRLGLYHCSVGASRHPAAPPPRDAYFEARSLLIMIQLRPVGEADLPFLLRLYASTRADELARLPWSVEQKRDFVAQQFEFQHRYWQDNYDGAAFDLIVQDGQPIGRLYVARGTQEIRIIDIALMPESRNAGIGTRLISEIFDEADRTGRTVGIHVEQFNPARRLYERLGFVQTIDRGVYLFMERAPRSQEARHG